MESDVAPVPPHNKKLRACLKCTLLMAESQFLESGCPNCERTLNMKGNKDRTQKNTTTSHDGIIAMCDNDKSWVARWTGTNDSKKRAKGIYAISVYGGDEEEE